VSAARHQHAKGPQIGGYGLYRCQGSGCEWILGIDDRWRHPNPNPKVRS
jgi:hypothetical protein